MHMFCCRSCALIVCIALLVGNAAAQTPEAPKACASKEFRAFDFWIGEWRVTVETPEGQQVAGHNSIRPILDGRAIEENWKDSDGSTGKSLTFYDPRAKRWHQTWIDSSAQALFIDGNFEGESLVLMGETGKGAKQTYHRITWKPVSGGV